MKGELNNKGIPPIKAEMDFLDKNERENYCIADWIQVRIDGKMTPVRIVAIRHDGLVVSNSPYVKGSPLDDEQILSNLYTLLLSGKNTFSTRPALCIQYAALLIEIDNAIVRFTIDEKLLKHIVIKNGKWRVDYEAWAKKIKEAGKNWGYKDYSETDDVCYFNPGFDYKQFLDQHELFWEQLHDKLNALVKLLEKMAKHVGGNGEETQKEEKYVINEDIVYISYSWSITESIDNMCRALDKAGVKYKRDVVNCGYRQNIKDFEREIGRGVKVLAFVNDEYLESINCMYELALVFQQGMVESRLFPIVTIAGKRDAGFCQRLYKFWNDEYLKRKDVINELPSGVSLQAIEELSYCDMIVRELPKITSFLSNVNTLTYEQLSANDFKVLVEEINRPNR